MKHQKRYYNNLVRLYNLSKRKLKRLINLGKNLRKQDILKRRLTRLHEKLSFMQAMLKGGLLTACLTGAMLLGTNQATQAQTFAPAVTNPFSLNLEGQLSAPSVGDLDDDGDMDVVLGYMVSHSLSPDGFTFMENIGSESTPEFTFQRTAFNLSVFGIEYVSPALADIDNDGDLDVMSGQVEGGFTYFENIGSPSSPAYDTPESNLFSLADVGTVSSASFADLDNDGDLDMISGERHGGFYYFRNDGSASSPSFAAVQANPFSLVDIGDYSKATFVDFDNDGDFDLMAGEQYGQFIYFENTGTAASPAFAAPQLNPFGLSDVGDLSHPVFVDLDDDGDLDLLSGENVGYLFYFENTSPLLPRIAPAWCGETLGGITNTVNFGGATGATEYEVRVMGPGGFDQTINRPNNSFKLSMLSGILYNTTYSVKIRAKVGGVWTNYGGSCSLSTPTVPGNTKLIPSLCGITLTASDQVLNYNEIYGATNYEIWVEGPGGYSSTQQRNSSATSFRLSWFPGIHLQKTYTVKVRAFVNGSWGSWAGMACGVTTPDLPLTNLKTGDCGITGIPLDQILEYNTIAGATNYEIWVQGPGAYSQKLYRNNNMRTFRLSWFPGTLMNTTYSVSVRSYVNGVWSNFGSSCSVTPGSAVIMQHEDTPEQVDASEGLEITNIEVYPNPNNGEFTIQSSHEGTFRLINELGQEIQTIEFTKENNYQVQIHSMNASNPLHPGIYFLTGTINGQVITQKIMITQ